MNGSRRLRLAGGDKVENISKKEFRNANVNSKRYNAKAANFLKSRGFTGTLTGIQLLNFSNAVLGLTETFKDEDAEFMDQLKSGVNFIGVSADLSEAFMNLKSAHLSARGLEVSETLGRAIRRAGTIGGAITSVMCFWEGCEAMGKDDLDSGVAYVGAGVAYGAATIIGILGVSGPVGWIALGIGFGLVALADALKDDSMQYYYKHFVLCDTKGFTLRSGETAMDYNRRLFKERSTLVDYDEKDIREEMTHPTSAIATLHDLTVCTNIKYYLPKEGFGKWIKSGHYKYHLGYEVTVTMNFKKFLAQKEQLEAKGILLNTYNNIVEPFDLEVKQAEVVVQPNYEKQLIATLVLPEEYRQYVNRYTKLVVALRVCIDRKVNHYFPYPLEDDVERYMGASISLYRTVHSTEQHKDQDIKFGSLKKLKDKDTW